MQKQKTCQRTSRRGFTLIELLVVISIIATLMSLILPAIQNAREAGRRTQCLNNIRNVATAAMTYASSARGGHLPAMGYYPEDPASAGVFFEGRSWIVDLLPYLDQQGTYDRWNKDLPWTNAVNLPLASDLYMEVLACPNDESSFAIPGGLSYVINAGFGATTTGAVAATQGRGHNFFDAAFDWNANGTAGEQTESQVTFQTGVAWPLFTGNGFLASLCKNKCTAPGKIYDGSSNTLMLAENINAGQTNWANPSLNSAGFMLPLVPGGASPGDTTRVSNVVLLNTPLAVEPSKAPFINQRKSGPEGAPFPNSSHPSIVVVAMCDGSAKTLSEDMDEYVYTQLMTPHGTRQRSLGGAAFSPENPVSGDSF